MKWIPRSLGFLLFCSALASCGGGGGGDITGPPPVATVNVTAPSTLFEGESSQAQAALRDGNGGSLSGRAINWTSSNPLVAAVTSGGLITAITAGTVTITATSEGRAGSSSLSVTRDPTPASIVLTPPALSVASGGSLQVVAEVKNGRGQVIPAQGLTYTSSAPSIASVSGDGIVSAVGPVGNANITASIGTTVSAPAVVTVSPGPAARVEAVANLPSAPKVASTNAVSVKVTDAFGNVVAGATVAFAIESGGGTITPASATTDAAGIASASFKLGNLVGTNTAAGTAAGLTGFPVSFSATTVSEAAATVDKKAGTDNQEATAGTAVPKPPEVTVTDAYGNPVAGESVSFTWNETDSDGNLVARLAVIPTKADGVAQLDQPWILSLGQNKLFVNVASLLQVEFTATGL